ncbi:MAG: hypothetical protein ABEJ28_10245 [Salinigranum sp.]
MRRRTLLAGVSACLGLAGCLATRAAPIAGTHTDGPSSADGNQSPGRPTPGGRTTTAAGGGTETTDGGRTGAPPGDGTPSPFPRRVAVAAVDDGAIREAFGVAADVSVLRGEVTPDATARVSVGLRTTDVETRRLTYERQECDRNEFRATNGDFGLYLFPAGEDWTRDGVDCPVVSGPNLRCGIPVVEAPVTVPASGVATWRYDAVVPPSNLDRGGCVVPGRYRFSRRFTADGSAATLSFVLSVTAP